MRPTQYKRLSKNKKTIHRAYGGNRCAECVRQRIVRAFLVEEQRIVKKVLKAKGLTKEAAEEKPAAAVEKKASASAAEKKSGKKASAK